MDLKMKRGVPVHQLVERLLIVPNCLRFGSSYPSEMWRLYRE